MNNAPAIYKKTNEVTRPSAGAQHIVPHWAAPEIARLIAACPEVWDDPPTYERNQLLILTLFDTATRVSEALPLTPASILDGTSAFRIRVKGKGGKYREAAISQSVVLRLRSFAYKYGIAPDARLFPFTRQRAHQIVQAATKHAGLEVPEGVGNVHILRHSGAIERLRQSGNPQSVQDQLGHSTPGMTLRYLRTLTADAAIGIQEQVDPTAEIFRL